MLAEFERRARALFEDVPLLALDEEGRPQPLTLRFDPVAEQRLRALRGRARRERHALGTSDEAEDEAAYLGWLSKLAGQTARLAACLHAAAHWTSGVTTNDDDRAPARSSDAVELARYFHAHALAVFGLMGAASRAAARARDPALAARRAADAELETLTVRDVHRSRGKGTTADEVRTALAAARAARLRAARESTRRRRDTRPCCRARPSQCQTYSRTD